MYYYDKQKKITYILNLDSDKTYGHALSQPFPIGGFEFIENLSIFIFDV